MRQESQEELTKFFKAIFEGTTGCIDIRTFIHTRKKDKVETKQRDHFFINIKELKDLVRIISNDNFTKDRNVHFGVAPRVIARGDIKQTGSENDVKFLNVIFSDIDCKRESDPNLPTKKETIKRIEKFELPPSIIVDSGLGYQVYWLLKKQIPIKNKKILLQTKGVLKGLAIAIGGDVAGQDVSHLLRVPGTRNRKPECPKEGLEVKIIKFEPNLKYGEEFKKYMVKIEDVQGVDIDIKDVPIPPRFEELLKKNKKLQNTYLTRSRPDLSDPSGSGYDMALANLLIKNKFTDSEIAAIIRSSKTGTKKKITPSYLNITIKKAKAFEVTSKTKFNPRPYSEEILKEYSLRSDLLKRFWIYKKKTGIWSDRAEIFLDSILRKRILGHKDFKIYCVKEIIEDLRGLTFQEEYPKEASPDLIPFKNVIFNIKTRKTIKYSPDYFFINKLAINYNPEGGSECPTIDRVFHEIVAEKDVPMLYQIVAYSVHRGYPSAKFFILHGIGSNGKTRYIDVLEKILGEENISDVSMTDLQFNRFAPSELLGKLLNVSGEMAYQSLHRTELLKEATGESFLRCERKFREAFKFKNYAKMVFSTNQVPLTMDHTHGFYRRVVLIEFPRVFEEGKDADPFIIKNIPEKEFEALGLWALTKLAEMKRNKFAFSNLDDVEKVAKKYKYLSNPVYRFLDDFTVKEVNSEIPKNVFYDSFISFAKDRGIRELTTKEVVSAMKSMGYEEKMIIKEENATRCWLELDWKK
jgi:P4 family phage/plasmid primase-like protien